MKPMIMRVLTAMLVLLLMAPEGGRAQTPLTLTLWDAYRLAREHYPSSKQRGLIDRTREYTVQNAARGYLPQLSFGGQATMQSDVTNLPIKIPIQGFSLPQYSKDQYKVYGEVDQVVYDGGAIRNQQEAAAVSAVIADQSLNVELHTVFDRVDQLYFGVLLLDAEMTQNELMRQDIRNGLEKMQALVDNGTAYQSGVDELKAQLLQAGEARTELLATRRAYMNMLLMLTGFLPRDTVTLTEPSPLNLQTTISRPELLLFEYQKRSYDLQDAMAAAQVRPRFSLFAQGGYGRPGLNMLSNNFAFYAIGGVRMSWNLGGWYTLKRTRQLSEIGRRSIDVQQETFLLNTTMQQEQAIMEIAKYNTLEQNDEPIIGLRTAVKKAALAQLTEGVLSAHDYLTQVNAEDQARQNRILHHIQLLQSEYNYQTLVGH